MTLDPNGSNQLTKGRYGTYLYNKHDMYVGKSLEHYGEYCQGEVDLFQILCRPGDVVIEVGSNIGAQTLPLSQFVGPTGHVFAFEPQRIIFQMLCANMALNNVRNVTCYPMAVGDAFVPLKVPAISYDDPGNFGGVELIKDLKGEDVMQVPLDQILTLNSLKLLKIDVEGMEANVLRGAQNMIENLKPILYVENDRPQKSQELIELVFSYGYRAFWDTPLLFNFQNYAHNKENHFSRCKSTNMICVPQEQADVFKGYAEILNSHERPDLSLRATS